MTLSVARPVQRDSRVAGKFLDRQRPRRIPLGGFSPLQSQILSDVAARLVATPMQVALA